MANQTVLLRVALIWWYILFHDMHQRPLFTIVSLLYEGDASTCLVVGLLLIIAAWEWCDEKKTRNTLKSKRDVQEMRYKGTTRAVVGAGFQVRELLFGDEFVTLRITLKNKKKDIDVGELRELVIRTAMRLNLREPPIDGIHVASNAMTLHLASKQIAAQMCASLKESEACKDLRIEPIRLPDLIPRLPACITANTVAGCVRVSWAASAATGAAALVFADVKSANAMLEKCNGRARPLGNAEIRAIGIHPDGPVGYGNGWLGNNQDAELQRALPPLCYVRNRDDRHGQTRVVFSETGISTRSAERACRFGFSVEIPSGLPTHVDEDALAELVGRTGLVDCKIQRKQCGVPDTITDENERCDRNRVIGPVLRLLAKPDAIDHWFDQETKRTGVVIKCSDHQRLHRVYTILTEWKKDQQVHGHPVRVQIESITRPTVVSKVMAFFRVKMNQVLRRERKITVCGVCMMPADEPVVQFSKCHHAFCIECIQPGIKATHRLPLVCPAGDCGNHVDVADVAMVAYDVDEIVETAVFDYVTRHPDRCAVCPKPGCNQIVPRTTTEFATFAWCESCGESYCLVCSEDTGREIGIHADVGCKAFQRSGFVTVDRHVDSIRDGIFTLRCPQCRAAFLDFDGCASVHCGNTTCNAYFCAACLAFSSPGSGQPMPTCASVPRTRTEEHISLQPMHWRSCISNGV